MIKNENQRRATQEWIQKYKEAIEAEKLKSQKTIETYQSQIDSLEAEIAEWDSKPLCRECYNGNYRWTTWNAEKCPTCGKSQLDYQKEGKGLFELGREAIKKEQK